MGVIVGGLIQSNTNFMDKPMIGASNGVSSLLGYFIARFPTQSIYMLPIPIPIPAWMFGLIFYFLNSREYN